MTLSDQELGYVVLAGQSSLALWAALIAWNEKLKERRNLVLLITFCLIIFSLVANWGQSTLKERSDRSRYVKELQRQQEAKVDGERLNNAVAEVARVTKLNTDLQTALLSTSKKIATMASHTFDQLTGGETYPEVTPIFPLGDANGYALTMSGVGSGPLVNASYSLALGEPPASLTDEQIKKIWHDTLNGTPTGEKSLGTIPWRNGRILQDRIKPTLGGPNVYRIGMRTANGSYNERLEVRFDPSVPGNWDYRVEVKRDIGLTKFGTVVLKKMSPWTYEASRRKVEKPQKTISRHP